MSAADHPAPPMTPALAASERDAPRSDVPPQPFHRLSHLELRTARWWRPLLVLLLTVVLSAVLFTALYIGIVLLTIVFPSLDVDPDLEDMTNPLSLVMMLGGLAILIPAVVLATRWAGGRRGTVHSVAGRFRWGLVGRAALVVLPFYAVVNWVTMLVTEGQPSIAWGIDLSLVLTLGIMVVLVPLQSAGEEYAFRVLPQQVLGTWLRSPLWGILLPAPLFMFAHGYSAWGLAVMGVFAVCMGVLVWKTGGIELAILVHAANNLTIFLATPFYPDIPIGEGGVSAGLSIMDMAWTLLLTAGLCVWYSRREGLALTEPATGRGRLSR